MNGRFYAVGVGPGDFEYMTLKAVRALCEADVIAVPVKKSGESSTALEITKKAVDLSGKRIEEVEFIMSRDRSVRLNSREKAAEKIAALLSDGKTVAMITLGDVSIYSTCSYVNERIGNMGYDTEIISGVPSFCAAAAAAGVSLCEENETLAVIPAQSEKLESVIDSFDNIVIMKAGKSIDKIYDCLKEHNLLNNAFTACRVGMDGGGIGKFNREDYGYFTTVIVKKNSGEGK